MPRDAPGVLPLLTILAEKDNARTRKLYDRQRFTIESLLLELQVDTDRVGE